MRNQRISDSLVPNCWLDKQLRHKYWDWDVISHDYYFILSMHWNIFTYFISRTCCASGVLPLLLFVWLCFVWFCFRKQNIVFLPSHRTQGYWKNVTCEPINITSKVHLRFLTSPKMWRESISYWNKTSNNKTNRVTSFKSLKPQLQENWRRYSMIFFIQTDFSENSRKAK